MLKRNMMMLLLILTTSISSNAQTIPGISPECQQPVIECVEACKQIITAADSIFQEQEARSELQKQLIIDAEARNGRLTGQLKDARVWYRAPEFVGPVGFFLGIVVVALVK